MDSNPRPQGAVRQKTLSNLTPLVPVNIEFTDLNYTVHQNDYGEFIFIDSFVCAVCITSWLRVHAAR
jgi:hypothetical protein